MHVAWKVLLRAATEERYERKNRGNESRYGDCAARATRTMVRHRKRPISARLLCTIMLESRSFVHCFTTLVLGLSWLVPSVALAASKDKAAGKLQTEAMQTD